MIKWVDYLISKVSYDPNHLITFVVRHKDTAKGITTGILVDRKTISSDIKNGISHITIYNNKDSWKKGYKIKIFPKNGNYYLRIDENKVKLDYLGDLPDDSTIPFSITLPSNQIVPGVYPATFKIVYTDDLKKSHEVIIDSQVKFQPQQNNLANSRNQGSTTDIPIYVYPIIAGILISYLVIKKLRKPKSKDNFSKDDIISILDKAKPD